MEIHQIILQLIFTAKIISADRIVEATSFEIDKQTCVSEDGRKTRSQISSLTVCASLYLTDETCRAVTYIGRSNMCHLSTDNNLHNCTLQKGDGTINGINPKAPCPEEQGEFCNADAQVYYEFVDTGSTWGSTRFDDAQAACEGNGGQLAVLDTDEKVLWLNELRDASDNFIRGNRFWIGLTLENGVGTWVNGEPLTTDSAWAGGQPDGSGRQCVETWGNSQQYYWTDEGCHNTKHYICEYSF